jgi:long-subunit fatty acid transport protein
MKKRPVLVVVFIAAAVLAAARPLPAQLILGQYEEEAPVGTWNTFPYLSAAALGRGQTAFTLARDASAGPVNPALLAFLPKVTLAGGGYYHIAAFNAYGPVNTGVLGSEGNIDLSVYGFDFAGVSFRLGGWGFGFSVSAPELYNRPTAEYKVVTSQGRLLEKDVFTQSGLLRDFNIAVARKIGSRLSLGLGLNIVRGELNRQWLEQWAADGGMYQILDHKVRQFQGIFVNGGIVYDIPDVFRLALVIRSPFVKKSDSRSDLTYDSADGVTEIAIPDTASDEYRQPLIAGMGVSCGISRSFTLAADVTYLAWSTYKATFFGDPDPRSFRDVVRTAVGGEYKPSFALLGARARVPLRLGFVYDPQPMSDPKSAYFGITVGSGLEWKFLLIDFGLMIGRESGSGSDLDVKRFALSMGIVL